NLVVQFYLMRKILLVCSCLLLLGSCRKAIEKIQENMLVDAMTDGQWKITNFVHDGSNITAQFDGFSFKYYRARTVDAIKNGVVEKTGNWDGDISTQTTWADFPSATEPLSLINGTWHIDNSSWTHVVATQTNGSSTKTMRLDKI